MRYLQLNNESCSESEVKEDDDLGTESSRSLHGASNKGGDPTLKGNETLFSLKNPCLMYEPEVVFYKLSLAFYHFHDCRNRPRKHC